MMSRISCPACEWTIRCSKGDEATFECPACGHEFVGMPVIEHENVLAPPASNDSTFGESEHPSIPLARLSKAFEYPSPINANSHIGGMLARILKLGVGLFAAFLLVFAVVGMKNHSEKQTQKHALQTLLKNMRIVCVATDQGVNRGDFRKIVRDSKAEYENMLTFDPRFERTFPSTLECIDKAFICWEAAGYFWSIQGKFNNNNEPQGSDYMKLVKYIQEGLGKDVYDDLNKTEGGLGQFLYSNKMIDSLISAFFSAGDTEVKKASSKLMNE